MGEIIVVGSINMDIVNEVDRFPQPGETIYGTSTAYVPGGKGANQAVAASKSGASVSMIGAVGQDAFGPILAESLRDAGVDTRFVAVKEGTSGLAFITVSSAGENQIILATGSNGKLQDGDIPNLSAFAEARTILLQNEIPWETNRHVLSEARKHGIPVIVNPAPALHISDEDLALIDMLVLNETEAAYMTGGIEDPKEAARTLIRRGVRKVVLTLGEQGSLYVDAAGKEVRMSAFQVKALDTTAAGDTFIGAFAAARMRYADIESCLRYASGAAALSVTKRGAQTSIPAKEETMRFINEQDG